MQKKVLVIFLVTSMAFFLFAACGGNQNVAPTAPAAPAAPAAADDGGATAAEPEAPEAGGGELGGELTFSVFMGEPFNSGWRARFDEFERQTGVRVHLDAVPWEHLREMQTLELASRSGAYDVIYAHPSWWRQFASQGYLLPIDYYTTEEDRAIFIPSMLELYRYGDHIFGLPDWVSTIMIAYRTDLFDEMGLSTPNNWDDILMIAETFYEADTDIFGVVFPGINQASLAGSFLTALLSNGSWIIDDNNNPTMETPEALETMRFFEQLAQFSPPGFTNFHWDDIIGVAAGGRAAMIFMLTPRLNDLEDPEFSQFPGMWNHVPIANVTYGGAVDSWAWAVTTCSRNQEAAGELVKFMTSTEQQLHLTAHNGTIGATIEYFERPEPLALLPFLPALNASLAANARPMPDWENWASEQDAIEINMQRMFGGELTPEQVLAIVQELMIANRS